MTDRPCGITGDCTACGTKSGTACPNPPPETVICGRCKRTLRCADFLLAFAYTGSSDGSHCLYPNGKVRWCYVPIPGAPSQMVCGRTPEEYDASHAEAKQLLDAIPKYRISPQRCFCQLAAGTDFTPSICPLHQPCVRGAIQLPPQPKFEDYNDSTVSNAAFSAALTAWERICREIISKESR